MPIRSNHSIRHRLRITARRIPRRALPDFLIIGAQRSGTSALHNLLSQHPQIRPPIRKEINFFTKYFDRGNGWYRAHFPLLVKQRAKDWLTFESTPYYLYHPLSPARAKSTVPEARLIAILRNPVDRAFSQYCFNVLRGRESRTFEEAIASEEADQEAATGRLVRGGAAQDDIHDHYSYLGRGRYVEQLQRWIEEFGQERLVILSFEEYRVEHTAAVQTICAFLHIRSDVHLESKTRGFEATRNESMPATIRSRLADYFAPFNSQLFGLIGRDLPWKP